LPCRVDFLDGSKVLYTYDANGTKLRIDYYINPMTAVVPQTSNVQGVSSITDLRHTWVDYCSNFIYENDTLKQTLIGGGYISYVYSQGVTQPTPIYHFYVHDHLGNNRLVVNENGTIEQVNHYYPYGGLMGESKNISSNQRYKYNGKELDRMHGLDWYDYGARLFNSALCRFTTVDPLATKYYGVDPYVFCGNNPVKNIDWNGMDYWSTSDRREIAAFCNQMNDNDGGGGTFHYDFSNWNHLTDDQFFSTGFYNDKTNKFYNSWTTIEKGEVVCHYEVHDVNVIIDNNHKNDVVNTISGALGASISLSNGIIQAHSNVTAGNGFCSYQNTVTEILGSDVGKLYSVGSKVCTALSVLSTTRSTINTLSYYNNGGNDWRVGCKYFIDTTFSVLGFFGPVGAALSIGYFVIDVSTNGFGGFGKINR